jgi:transposase InsO family protein
MPWKEATVISERYEFVVLASQAGANIQQLCDSYGISRTTGYKWLQRWQADGVAGLEDHSRRPRHSPRRSSDEMEALVLATRDRYPTWGGRKVRAWLARQGVDPLPSASTITAILARHGRLQSHAPPPVSVGRFEAAAPNDLWQLDFMGHRPLQQGRVHPLTVLDDHSRFVLALVAAADQRLPTVQTQLEVCFRRYGVPARILSDHGPPWGASGMAGLTRLEAWWIRLGIEIRHGRPYHPQTQGKVERLHRTIRADVFGQRQMSNLVVCQQVFDQFRTVYNLERPHDALGLEVPASRYQPSPRPFPDRLPEVVYAPGEMLRQVSARGSISVSRRGLFVGRGLTGQCVAVRPTLIDRVVDVYFAHHHIGRYDLRTGLKCVNDVSEHL